MAHVVRSTIIDASTDQVWGGAARFQRLRSLAPCLGGQRRSSAARARIASVACAAFKLADGSELREQLLALSDLEQSFSYCLLDTPIPLFNYVAHVRLLPVTDGDRTFWHWESRFTTRPGEEKPMTDLVSERDLSGGFRRDPQAPRRSLHDRGRFTMPVTVKTFATPTEAAAALSDRSARYIGGGTLVMRALNEGDVSIATIVRLEDRSLTQIRASGARITIGAGVTLSQILRERELSFLHAPARLIGGPAVRTNATVGGNLFAPAPYGDLAVALLALDATVSVMSGYGARDMALEEFLASRDRSPGALVLSVTCDRPPSPEAFRFRKAARVKPKGVSVLSIAVSLSAVGGRVSGPRIAYGAMAPTAIRAKAAERALEGKTLDEAGVAAAVAAAAEGTSPATDAIASAWYRREVVGVHLRRLLLGQDG